MGIITLTTDFGWSDHYVGAMKGVILSVAPRAAVVDIVHLAPRGNVRAGAFIMRHACMEFPPATVHVGVVDPGVGTARRLLAMRAGDSMYLAPDNGLLSLIAQDSATIDVRVVENETWMRTPRSNTFHGRDILAPVAARLCLGAPFDQVGPPIQEPLAALPPTADYLCSPSSSPVVVYVDHYGNIVTSLTKSDIQHAAADLAHIQVRVGNEAVIGIRLTYADVARGDLVAYFGSAGLLEIAENGGDAARRLNVRAGDGVTVV